MPPTMEVRCTNPDCEVDMFELHFTYDVRDDLGVEELACPDCGQTDTLDELEV
ncbi:MAG: hypothetical protein ABEJ58_08130 [Halodesulfurarchaeum sp.]